MMSSCCTFRLKRRRALSRDSSPATLAAGGEGRPAILPEGSVHERRPGKTPPQRLLRAAGSPHLRAYAQALGGPLRPEEQIRQGVEALRVELAGRGQGLEGGPGPHDNR